MDVLVLLKMIFFVFMKIGFMASLPFFLNQNLYTFSGPSFDFLNPPLRDPSPLTLSLLTACFSTKSHLPFIFSLTYIRLLAMPSLAI